MERSGTLQPGPRRPTSTRVSDRTGTPSRSACRAHLPKAGSMMASLTSGCVPLSPRALPGCWTG